MEEQNQQDKLAQELAWCINKLESEMISGSMKGAKAADAQKALKVFKDPKAPLPKIRQAMRSAFGDYRKQMDSDVNKHVSAVKNSQIRQVEPAEFKFYKKSASVPSEKTELNTCSKPNESHVAADVIVTATVPVESTSFSLHSGTATADVIIESSTANIQQTSTLDEPVKNYFHMKPTGNDFRFNFE